MFKIFVFIAGKQLQCLKVVTLLYKLPDNKTLIIVIINKFLLFYILKGVCKFNLNKVETVLFLLLYITNYKKCAYTPIRVFCMVVYISL